MHRESCGPGDDVAVLRFWPSGVGPWGSMEVGAWRYGLGKLYQLEEILPVVLGHEAEESEEGPAEGVIAGVAIVGVPSSLDALIALGAVPRDRMKGWD